MTHDPRPASTTPEARPTDAAPGTTPTDKDWERSRRFHEPVPKPREHAPAVRPVPEPSDEGAAHEPSPTTTRGPGASS